MCLDLGWRLGGREGGCERWLMWWVSVYAMCNGLQVT